MSASKNNIQFNYIYRDAGNYKVFGYVVFANPQELSLEFILWVTTFYPFVFPCYI